MTSLSYPPLQNLENPWFSGILPFFAQQSGLLESGAAGLTEVLELEYNAHRHRSLCLVLQKKMM